MQIHLGQANGPAMSSLDRILVFDNWFETWRVGSLWLLSEMCQITVRFSNHWFDHMGPGTWWSVSRMIYCRVVGIRILMGMWTQRFKCWWKQLKPLTRDVRILV